MAPARTSRAEWWQGVESRCPRAHPQAPDPLLLLQQYLLLNQMVCSGVAGRRCTKAQHRQSISGIHGCFTVALLWTAVIAACIRGVPEAWVAACHEPEGKMVC